jgi:D-glucosaminate-6-phosphate ammonia-lyase
MNRALTELGIDSVINAAGTITLLSGSRIAPDIAEAMTAAAQECIDMGLAQGRASEIIAECTGAEAGIVTSGASAGLMLGAAACIAGLDPQAMEHLPDTSGLRNEFIVPRSHRNSYDHAIRACGGRLIEVGYADRLVGVGVRDTEAWEIARAITPKTAGIFYVARPGSRPRLSEVAAVAQAAGVPLLVDAAAELPPAANLRVFLAAGADLVVFSGGKALGGPSASGILCGRRHLVASALLQHLDLDYDFDAWTPPAGLIDKEVLKCVPRHGIGRSCKVGKEQIVGLLLALRRFAGASEARTKTLGAIAHHLVDALGDVPGLQVRSVADPDGRGVTLVEVQVTSGLGAPALAAQLASARPSVRLDASRAESGVLVLVPTCLSADDAPRIREAFVHALAL